MVTMADKGHNGNTKEFAELAQGLRENGSSTAKGIASLGIDYSDIIVFHGPLQLAD